VASFWELSCLRHAARLFLMESQHLRPPNALFKVLFRKGCW